jgi:Flp pilus assembly protein TadG
VSPTSRWRNERGLVGKMLVILLLVIAVLGVAAIEAGSIIFTKLTLENTASNAAADGARDLASSHSANSACQAAAQSTAQQDKSVKFLIKLCKANPSTGEIFVVLRKTAPTLIVRRVGFLRKLGVVKASAETGPGRE